VAHYLRKHKKVVDIEDRVTHLNHFALYLVVQCWPMMCQRITDWSSQGYIYELSKIPEDKLITASSDLRKDIPNRDNWGLAGLVLMMVESGRMERFILGPCGRSEWRSEQFTNLVAAFSKLKEPDASELHSHMYGTTTCVEFHRLLLATLLAYGHALCALKNAEGTADLVQLCQQVWCCSRLLREMAASLMLRQHLRTCARWLRIPINAEWWAKIYQEYTGFTVSGFRNPNVDDPGCADYGGIPLDGSETLDQVFLNWICLQVTHLLALGTLTRMFSSPADSNAKAPSEVPKISLLAVRYPSPRAVEPWRTTLTNLLSQATCNTYSAQDVIDVIVSCAAAPPHQSNHPIFATFKSAEDLGQPIKFTSTMHCEVVLASLAKYSHDVSVEQINDSLELMQLLQVTLYLYDHDVHQSDTLCRT
jgi:hypothetical protein